MASFPGEDEVDLAQYIYESIVLSLPYQRVHPEGECDPEMLGRFRIVSDEDSLRSKLKPRRTVRNCAKASGPNWPSCGIAWPGRRLPCGKPADRRKQRKIERENTLNL